MAEREAQTQPTIEVPAPTAWPMLMALGLAFLFAGLVLNLSVSLVGAVLAIAGAVGWAREVIPQEHCEAIELPRQPAIAWQPHPAAARLEIGEAGNRAVLPLEIYPYSAGIKGGLAGGVVMAVMAGLYGWARYGSLWYPINILAASVMPGLANARFSELARFNLEILLIATLIHALVSLLVGLLYGVLLPMLPRRPVLFGGVIAPLMWSGFLWASLSVINPVLDQRIDWGWFVLCQFGFGLTAGLVTARAERIHTLQFMPFAVRSGLEAPGLRGPQQ
ncbi:MAG TPA: hypothetical protein VKV28_01860 [Candidatus Binataceae bacterium]|nr:hypothetical protein [Candidatus Binataceae bacterium]